MTVPTADHSTTDLQVRSRGWFVAFEGGEGSGKSTQAARLAERIGAVRTREPGGTPLGQRIRGLFLDPDAGAVDARSEVLLMAADRAEHVTNVIRPALAAGRHVVTDRYLYSSIAYQAYGRGLDPADVARINDWATSGLHADLVVLLDVPVPIAAARAARRGDLDRMENEAVEFHERVRAGFLHQAAAAPDRWVVIDGTADPDTVTNGVWEAYETRLGSHRSSNETIEARCA